MNIENRATKIMLKNMPSYMVEELIALYKIPSPYKEILIMTCVKEYTQFKAMKELGREGIHLSFRSFTRKQAVALEKFRVAHIFYKDS